LRRPRSTRAASRESFNHFPPLPPALPSCCPMRRSLTTPTPRPSRSLWRLSLYTQTRPTPPGTGRAHTGDTAHSIWSGLRGRWNRAWGRTPMEALNQPTFGSNGNSDPNVTLIPSSYMRVS
jgi:hypothetical protein